ncbi:hypothetical protein K144316041_26560 [Clostridium tetani]|uniref:Uncharacterized protein n=1 Tax=Clostridium tetani TaxID=1513 RepID=A0A4Q0VC16_CLOTA|nr:hypothetical protein [Clostridium tetani]RXI46547.1 hypothetical protein DP130_10410 [Clostridium tetani]BDR68387.1 hypothetical protein K144312032_26150 [Clostridium tetani]BDR73948.1 hypothetical protein K144316041_26560 [Clostridium tetani]BDR82318.1 hypothetical protein K234311028_25640 [Clostridium tetani]BDR90707.1 hypothetical protein N072000002_25080 [Clostridium tetani]
MKDIIYISGYNQNKIYNKNDIITNIIDKMKIKFDRSIFIKDLGIKILNVKMPYNINSVAYNRNFKRIIEGKRYKDYSVAPKVWRKKDFKYFNSFQKDLFSYSVSKSIQLILRLQNKSIKNSTILVYDPLDEGMKEIIKFICIMAKNLIFLTEDISKVIKISECISANYGIAPIITKDKEYALKYSDFVVTSRNIKTYDKPIWYIDNLYEVDCKSIKAVNDVYYNVPWNIFSENNISIEVLGAILNEMEEKNVEKALKYNGIELRNIKFNDRNINFIRY